MAASAIILAAGMGTRMKSKKPKVAHILLGKPVINWVIDAAHGAEIDTIVSVLGHERDQVIPLVEDESAIVFQEQLLGTADAVLTCKEKFADYEGSVLVLSGDCPLILSETIQALVDVRETNQAAAAVLTMQLENPFGYGRIIRDEQGNLLRIVEEKDCNPAEKEIKECNSGFYCFDARSLFSALEQVGSENAQGEFYLTDVLEICRSQNKTVAAFCTENAEECLGINSRAQLAQAAKHLQQRINAFHMDNGVTMLDPSTVWIGPDVVIENDVEILPQTFLFGKTSVGEDSVIGPATRLIDTAVGKGCTIDETIAIEACVDDFANCGPRAYLRPGTHLCEKAKVGTHVEVKKSTVGVGSKVPHLSYIGDTTIGKGVNIGAGSITCNYDGEKKYPTIIEDGVFVGSDTMLVAPVTIGENAIIGAGSVITDDVSAGALGLGRARQTEISEYRKSHHPDES
ncbi:MAG: bifunctional UDP-N-acetylglucosamine diphosphorylase/glucosamine-1-phosphate N-acetyltransferase GlmU [Eggerthellaceae bacterium]|jgi:bifunctional UDP-N-acetylglucosamine pyrophosphorylase/glucosamine-1-phosphate N-acetyltransferase|nr:bifunctional UDP-N-acetylglucosamine diphosphorylase/glucosamine-1-phosphate N-acetyltransferase GlmU [Eggerthellaceae bacterium]MDR2721267.1 bifunctional UDP-N-acetylglucosamine diphosphorylase/glucosamine-1-phosphate N-acetyltransferase GlmU [Coriobacteriaceae bacterium]